MTDDLTVVRALEIVLSRVKMDRYTARDMTHALEEARRRTVPVDRAFDPDRVRCDLRRIMDQADGVDDSYNKRLLLFRIGEMRRIAFFCLKENA